MSFKKVRSSGILEEASPLHSCSGSLGPACADRSGLGKYEADGQQREATRWHQLSHLWGQAFRNTANSIGSGHASQALGQASLRVTSSLAEVTHHLWGQMA